MFDFYGFITDNKGTIMKPVWGRIQPAIFANNVMHPNTAALVDKWSNCSRNANVTCQWLLSFIFGFIFSIILVSVCARARPSKHQLFFGRKSQSKPWNSGTNGSEASSLKIFLGYIPFPQVTNANYSWKTSPLQPEWWVSHIPPSSMGMGQAERCTILLYISTSWCTVFPSFSGYLGNRMKLSIQQRAKIACHSWAQWPLVNQLSTPEITWHSFCCHMVQMKEHSIVVELLETSNFCSLHPTLAVESGYILLVYPPKSTNCDLSCTPWSVMPCSSSKAHCHCCPLAQAP